MSKEIITPLSTTGNGFDPKINYNYGKRKVKFKGICLKQVRVSFFPGNVVNSNISYKLDTCSRDSNTDFTLCDCLFGTVKWTNNADPDKCRYIGYCIGFNAPCLGRNIVNCGV